MTKSDEDRDIEKAKAALFGVDSVASISDFEVGYSDPHRC